MKTSYYVFQIWMLTTIVNWFWNRIKKFFEKVENADLEDNRKAAVQGFDNIFTLNYDNNIEKLIHRPVYYLHGDFSVLANSENVENVLCYIRTLAGETVWFQEMKQYYCNALLNKYNCNYNIPDAAQDIISVLNLLSDDKIGFDEIKNRVNQVPQFEMIRLCKAVKEDMKRRNPLHESTEKKILFNKMPVYAILP